MYKRSHSFHLVPVLATFCSALFLCSTLAACTFGQQSAESSIESSSIAEVSSVAATSVSSAAESLRDSSAPSSAEEAPPTKPDRTDIEITNAIMSNFAKLAAIPRQSGNEAQVSEYLRNWAEGHGYTVTKDDANNIIFDVPATRGHEDQPLVGLQAHMDMVCAADGSIAYNPSTDAIEVIRDDASDTVTAEGTSLGADDGIGIAIIMDIANDNIAHGPLRVILTTDEEGDMTGVKAIDPDFITDLSYLINLDGEMATAVVMSSAGYETLVATSSLDFIVPVGDTAATVTLDGLLGGNASQYIGEGRCNAAREMASFINYLTESKIEYELSSITAGTSENTIPDSASATIVFKSEDADTISILVNTYKAALDDAYEGLETDISMSMRTVKVPEWAMTSESAGKVLDYALNVFDGAYTMSPNMEGIVESSSNLGMLNANSDDGFSALILVRSLDNSGFDDIEDLHISTVTDHGCDLTIGERSSDWSYNDESKLLDLAKKVYHDNNGSDIKVEVSSMALECGVFANMNPDLDIIRIGPDIANMNTPDETLRLGSIPVVYHLVEGILSDID